jgi:hypothetical protein
MQPEQKYIVFGEHLYQPFRKSPLNELANVQASPDGVDWTDLISRQCYLPQLESGVLSRAAFDMYGSLRTQLNLSPEQADHLKQAMAQQGVGDAFLHPIFPDLDQRDRRTLIMAGREDFFHECGHWPEWLWPPETALDTPSLIDIKRAGYQGVICAPEQLVREDGLPTDNQPLIVSLPENERILMFPFDRPISTALAFADITNADQFIQKVILPRIKGLPDTNLYLTWTDGETFGHHVHFGDLFLSYLLANSLPDQHIHPISLAMAMEMIQERIQLGDLPEAKLIERTAWSCPHGDLKRWNGECGCSTRDASWKQPFMQALRVVNQQVTGIIDGSLPDWEAKLQTNFRRFFTTEPASSDEYLLMAKASSLAALTSCATFFDNPHTSGRLNVLFVLQSVIAMSKSGLRKQSDQLFNDFTSSLDNILDPTGTPLARIVEDLLTQ